MGNSLFGKRKYVGNSMNRSKIFVGININQYFCASKIQRIYFLWKECLKENYMTDCFLGKKKEKERQQYLSKEPDVQANQLFFYTWPRDEKHNYEIDFLLSRGFKIQPIEVKSSGYSTHASLDEFCRIFHERIDKRFLIYTKDLKIEDKMIYLPMYMTPLI